MRPADIAAAQDTALIVCAVLIALLGLWELIAKARRG